MAFTEIINKLKAAKKFDVVKETADIINENGDYISGLLLNQFREGKDADEKVLTLFRPDGSGPFPFYSDATIFQKFRKRQPTDRITYYDSGRFYTGMNVYTYGNTFVFESDVSYFGDILEHAGSGYRIIELSKKNLERFRDEILAPQLKIRFDQLANV